MTRPVFRHCCGHKGTDTCIEPMLAARDGQHVQVMGRLPDSEVDAEVGPMFYARFPDGFVGHVFEDELADA